MDPDGLSIAIMILCAVVALLSISQLGAVSAADSEHEKPSRLGFTDRVAGLCVVLFFGCAFFIYGALCQFAAAPLWALIPGAFLCVCLIAAYSLGLAQDAEPHKAFLPLRILGVLFAAPAKLLLRGMKLTANSEVTEEDVLSMMDDVEEQALIDESQKRMIANIFELDDVTAGDMMTHRTEIISVQEQALAGDAVAIAAAAGVSRLPVYHKNMDDIVGVLYVKDLFGLWDVHEKNSRTVSEFVRSVRFVPESCRARDLLIDFKVNHTQIAVVVDEYGGTSGLVTMEDVLEEIVGNIQDEYDNEEEELVQDGDGFIVTGATDLEDVFDAFDLKIPEDLEDADYDTVSGLVLDRLGKIPTAHEAAVVCYGGLNFEVLQVGERRIDKIRCTRTATDAQAQVENEE